MNNKIYLSSHRFYQKTNYRYLFVIQFSVGQRLLKRTGSAQEFGNTCRLATKMHIYQYTADFEVFHSLLHRFEHLQS